MATAPKKGNANGKVNVVRGAEAVSTLIFLTGVTLVGLVFFYMLISQ